MAKRHIIPLFIPHAGCGHTCVFCNQRKITGADTSVTPELVQCEIEAALRSAGGGCELAFYGGSFTAIAPETQEALLQAVQPYVRSGAVTAIRCSTRPDAIDPEVIDRLLRYHVTTVELGCQSMDPEVLRCSERGHTPEDTVRAAELLKKSGLQLILQMMTGLPGDDGSASLETAGKMIALQPDGVRIYPTVVLRDTRLLTMLQEGTYQAHSVEAAVPLCAALYEKFLAAGIPVIRLGLNPTELLSGGEAVAGAYHPALGELVLSEMFLARAEKTLKRLDIKANASVRLLVHPSRISVMAGQKRGNLIRLREKYALRSLRVAAGTQDLWEVDAEIMELK